MFGNLPTKRLWAISKQISLLALLKNKTVARQWQGTYIERGKVLDCKVIVNSQSGNCKKLDLCALLDMIGCPTAEVQYINDTSWQCGEKDTLVVCGGDGTLKHALAKCKGKQLVFAPCGTLNESKFFGKQITDIGCVNDELFGYVCATGTFTEIGYLAENKHKQQFKALAYLPLVLKTYTCRQICAQIDVDGRKFDGEYTLLMALKSKRCFGFRFNRAYDKNPHLYLLAVKSFGKDNLWNKIRLFFNFFRIFFVGIDKPIEKKQFFLLPFDNATITLQAPQDFCMDGEKVTLDGTLHLCTQKVTPPIKIVKTPFLKRKKR